jgi:hypothetical protein
MTRLTVVAVTLALTGLLLTVALPPDPWPYVGATMVVTASIVALVALLRDPSRKAALVALAVALLPLALLMLAFYVLAARSG